MGCLRKRVGQSGSLPKSSRFLQYDIWKKNTGQFVGPGTYNEDKSYKRLVQERCTSIYRDRHIGSSDNHWVVSGHLTKFEPGFVARRSTKTFSSKGINVYNAVDPGRAFKNSDVRSIANSTSSYITGEQAKIERMKSFSGKGESLQSQITPFLTIE